MLRPVYDLLDPHLQDYVGVRADPGASRGDVAQKRIECGPGLALMDRIDPDKHPMSRQKLLTYLVGEFLVIYRRLGIDADSGKLLEDR